MATPTLQPSDDLLRFVSVRAIQEYDSVGINERFIHLAKDPDVQKVKANNPNTSFLFFDLAKYKDNDADTTANVVNQLKKTDKMILSESDVHDLFPSNLHSIFNWLQDEPDHTLGKLITKINTLLGQPADTTTGTISNFLNQNNYIDKKFSLYETLSALFLYPEPAFLMEEVQQMIRVLWVFQRIAAPDTNFAPSITTNKPLLVRQALNATIVLPFETGYPVANAAPNNPNNLAPPSKDNSNNKDKQKNRLADLNKAYKELTEKNSANEIDEKYKTRSDSGESIRMEKRLPQAANTARLLPMRYLNGLSQTTHDVIDSFHISKDEGLNIDHVLERISAERKKITDEVNPPPRPRIVVNIGGRFLQSTQACIPYKYDPCAQYNITKLQYLKMAMRTPGWGDLKVIKSVLLKYDKGEIAHIENILKGEDKVREINVIKKTEETLFNEEEITSENDKEAQTTDRFEVQREINSQIKEDMKLDTGVKVTAKLGTVTLDTHLDFTYTRAKDESNKTTTKNSQELVNKAVSKVTEKKKTQRTVTTIVTTEDKNKHTIDNAGGLDNIHGMYFWVDKYYLAKVVNYGYRFMLEFIVPEPAAYYIYSKSNKPQPENARLKPIYPQVKDSLTGLYRDIKSYLEITEDNYAEIAAPLNANVKCIDPEVRVLGGSYSNPSQESTVTVRRGGDSWDVTNYPVVIAAKDLQIPAGYIAQKAYVTVAGTALNSINTDVSVMLGKVKRDNINFNYTMEFSDLSDGTDPRTKETDFIPFSIWAKNRHELVANIEIICSRTKEHKMKWQKETFDAIITAYNNELGQFLTWQKEQEINAGVSIQGNNTEMNRAVEREELKKNCIELMTGQTFEAFNMINNNVPPLGYPEMIPGLAFNLGKDIQFFEQAFEWEQMTYIFYPYFWGRKANWVMIKSINDSDPVFNSFLQAGAARVLVPARPGFEDAVNFFLQNQKIWNGTNPPIPGDKLWISIADELKAQQGLTSGGKIEGIPWIYKVPTSLVYLEKTTFTIQDTDASASYPKDLKIIDDNKTSVDFQ